MNVIMFKFIGGRGLSFKERCSHLSTLSNNELIFQSLYCLCKSIKVLLLGIHSTQFQKPYHFRSIT